MHGRLRYDSASDRVKIPTLYTNCLCAHVSLYLFVLLYFSTQYHTAYAGLNASVCRRVVLLALLGYT